MAGTEENRIITIGGGKGGVGRSFVACNLGGALAQLGARVVLVDANLGAASLHTMLGVASSRSGVAALLNNEVASLDDASVETSIPNLRLVIGSTALGQPGIKHPQKRRLMRCIQKLDADVVVVDGGSDFGTTTLDLFNLGYARFIVTTPELTALQSNFSFLKAALIRHLQQVVQQSANTDRRDTDLAAWSDSDHETLDQMLAPVQERSSAIYQRIQAARAAYNARLLMNMVQTPADQAMLRTLARMGEDLLGLDCAQSGSIPHSQAVSASIQRRVPLVSGSNEPAVTQVFRVVAEGLARDLGITARAARTPPPASRRTALGFDVERLDRAFMEGPPTVQLRPKDTISPPQSAPRPIRSLSPVPVSTDLPIVAVTVQQRGKKFVGRLVEVRSRDISILTRGELHAGEEWMLVIDHEDLKSRIPTLVVRSWPKKSMVDLQVQLPARTRDPLMRGLADCLRSPPHEPHGRPATTR